MRKALIFVLMLASWSQVFCSENPVFTATMMNGRGWKMLKTESKLAYVAGLYDGMGYADLLWKDGHLRGRYLAQARYDEISEAVDQFYSDPANAAVPVLYAIEIFRMRKDGEPAADIARKIEEVRRITRALEEMPPK